jgi:hypothetical protein
MPMQLLVGPYALSGMKSTVRDIGTPLLKGNSTSGLAHSQYAEPMVGNAC